MILVLLAAPKSLKGAIVIFYKPDVYGSEQSVLYFPPTTTVPELTLPVFCDVLTS